MGWIRERSRPDTKENIEVQDVSFEWDQGRRGGGRRIQRQKTQMTTVTCPVILENWWKMRSNDKSIDNHDLVLAR